MVRNIRPIAEEAIELQGDDVELPLADRGQQARAARAALQGRPARHARILDDIDQLQPGRDRIGGDARPLRVQGDAFVRLLVRRDPNVQIA
jgi:hypothetical protein